MRAFRLPAGVLLGLALPPVPVVAQDYPSRPITMIVPFAAGGTSDVSARLITEQMSQHLDQRLASERLPTLPNVPTAAEAGMPEFQIQGWYALFAPKDTSAPVIARLNDALCRGVTNAEYQQKLGALGSYVIPQEEITPDYLKAFVPREIDKFRALIADGK